MLAVPVDRERLHLLRVRVRVRVRGRGRGGVGVGVGLLQQIARDCTCASLRFVEVTDPSSLRVTFFWSGCHFLSHVRTARVPGEG